MRDLIRIFNSYNFKAEILVANAGYPLHLVEAANANVDAVIISFAAIEQQVKHHNQQWSYCIFVGLQRKSETTKE